MPYNTCVHLGYTLLPSIEAVSGAGVFFFYPQLESISARKPVDNLNLTFALPSETYFISPPGSLYSRPFIMYGSNVPTFGSFTE